MLRIDQLRLHPGQQETLLRARCAKLLRVAPADITACTVLRKAIDAREDAKRALIESAGRKEILMLLPLVFLILPLSVLFAVFPGIVMLKLGIS